MILRRATDADADALELFDVGDTSVAWLGEVEEIRRRVARVRSGADDAIDWETVRSKAQHRLTAG